MGPIRDLKYLSEFNIKDFTQIVIPSVTGSILFQDRS